VIRKVGRKERLSLRKDILKTVVLITSKDHYRATSALAKIAQGLNKPGEYTFDCETATPKSGELSAALERAQMLPLGAERRVLIIPEAQDLTKDQAALLESYLERSVSTTSLVMAGEGLKKDSRAWKLVEKHGDVLEMEEYDKNEFPALIREAFEERGKKVSNRAIGYMRENLGQDLGAVYAAIEKIDLYHEGRNEIDVEDVVPFVAASAERTVFELIDQVSIKDLNHSLKLLEAMLKQGEDDTRLLNMLVWHFRRMIFFKALRKEGRDDKEIVKYLVEHLNFKPFLLMKLKQQSQNFSMEELKGIYERLLRFDVASKTSDTSDPHHLELLIYDICGCPAV
jgi:DNA polymerase III subunit delta